MAHLNFASPPVWLRLRFHAGRAFGSVRARDWPLWKRSLFVCASPAIPVIRAARIVRESRRGGRSEAALLLRVLPLLVLGLIIDAAGELTGYLAGHGATEEREWNWEFHRERHA